MKRSITILLLATVAALAGCTATEGERTSARDQEIDAVQGDKTEETKATRSEGEGTVDPTFEGEKPEVEQVRTPPVGADPSTLTFADVEPILTATCGSCHRPTMFGNIEKIKAIRHDMLQRIESGAMPAGNPTWAQTDDGRAVLDFLRNSPDLQ